jgi:hypothetical protein
MLELIDKLSNTINKYKLDFNDININILSKSEKVVYYVISIKYEDNIKSKKYKKYIVPFNRKTQINENSLNNLKYMKKTNMLQLDDNISKSIENNVNNKLIKYTEFEKCNKDDCEYEHTKKVESCLKDNIYNTDIQIEDSIEKKIKLNIKTNDNIDFDDKRNINSELIIDDYGCDNCIIMDNNVIYLSNRIKDLYLDILKNLITFWIVHIILIIT